MKEQQQAFLPGHDAKPNKERQEKPLFKLGLVVGTPGALQAVEESG
jgi:hypothetical protein